MNHAVTPEADSPPEVFSSASLLNGSPVACFVIDAEHVVTHMNQACADLLGIDAGDAIGSRALGRRFYGQARPLLADLVVDGGAPERFDDHYGEQWRGSTSIDGAYEADEYCPHLGRSGRWLSHTAAPLRDPDGNVIGAIETLLDISDARRAEAELRETQQALNQQLSTTRDQLEQADKLASIGQLAAGVAHEINNPIGYIFSNFGTLEKYLVNLMAMLDAYEAAEATHGDPATVAGLQAMRERIELDYLKEDIPALMQESHEGIVRVRKIVQDLKDFSRVDTTHEWLFTDLRQCIASTLNVVNAELKYKADLVCDLIEAPEVECRASEINQVIMNLLVNAAQAIGDERGTITIRNGFDDHQVWFEIEDTGSGISQDQLKRLFDPFFTTKPVGKGTGLGLSISYGIVQKHHGRITVRTVVGQGSAFRVTLPIEQPAAGSAAPRNAPT